VEVAEPTLGHVEESAERPDALSAEGFVRREMRDPPLPVFLGPHPVLILEAPVAGALFLVLFLLEVELLPLEGEGFVSRAALNVAGRAGGTGLLVGTVNSTTSTGDARDAQANP
jgi:hypothetical protein